jgi:hypothetical protein
MALFSEPTPSCAPKELDTADIVRDRDFSPVIGVESCLPQEQNSESTVNPVELLLSVLVALEFFT